MMIQFLDSFWGVIDHYIDMLKDSAIADYLFNGVSLWLILISLFCLIILLRFFLNPVPGGGLFSMIRSVRPQHIEKDGDSNG